MEPALLEAICEHAVGRLGANWDAAVGRPRSHLRACYNEKFMP